MCALTERGEKAQADILAAATEMLLETGVEGMSLRQVAARAGYVPSALYNHFSSKDELVARVAMASVGLLGGYLGAVPSGAALERLRGLGVAYVRFADDHPVEYRLIFDCLANPPHSWDDYVAVAHPFSLIVDTCREGLGSGELVDRDGVGASGLAYALWSLVDGHVHLRLKHLAAVDGPYAAMFSSGLDALLRGFSPASDERTCK